MMALRLKLKRLRNPSSGAGSQTAARSSGIVVICTARLQASQLATTTGGAPRPPKRITTSQPASHSRKVRRPLPVQLFAAQDNSPSRPKAMMLPRSRRRPAKIHPRLEFPRCDVLFGRKVNLAHNADRRRVDTLPKIDPDTPLLRRNPTTERLLAIVIKQTFVG